MNISRDKVVYFHYTVRGESGEALESSLGGEPSTFLHGAGNILPGLESEMEGRCAGDSFTVTLEPDRAYGRQEPGKVQRVPVKHMIFKGKLQPGMVVQLNTSHGQLPVKVVKVGRHSADVDTNHPLAGQTLSFDIEVVDVREATAEELAHGHVHGPGGHQH